MASKSLVVCTWNAPAPALPSETTEVLTLGYQLAHAIGGDLRLLVAGELSDGARLEASRYAVATIDHVRAPGLHELRADRIVQALTLALESTSADVVLFAQTFDARLIAPRVAARLNAAIVMNCIAIQPNGDALDATVTAFGGDTRAVYRCAPGRTYVFSISANAVVAEPLDGDQRTPQVRDLPIDVSKVEERVRVVERPQASVGPRLEHAQVVVAGGRGLGVPENFRLVEELAAALGGMAAASRPIVDDGWAKPSQQVGLTGKITKPALYIAAGISGASQHMVGCAAAKTMVAINRDKDAAIFRYARYGVVGDCTEILPALTEAIRSARK